MATKLDYDGALRRVMSLPDFERSTRSPGHSSFHLERMSLILDRLGNPHLGIPTVHIAGTNGKGSTAAMVSSVLTAAGYTTGLYTSPHLHTTVERIRVGLEPIRRDEFAALLEGIWPEVEWVGREGGYGPLTFFELLTALAFLHFREIGADFQVIEVGLGGRLDATNLVQPEVCAITSISLDHVVTLGGTVGLIAAEKAGIIKSGVPVVVSPQSNEAMEAIARVSRDRGAPLVRVNGKLSSRQGGSDLGGQRFDVEGLDGRYAVWSPLLGNHQMENAATAIVAVETLVGRGFDVPRESIIEGIRRVRWPARLQTLSRAGKLMAVDGAHNPDAMNRLVAAVRKAFEFRRLFLIFGAGSGHSARGMLAEAAELSPMVLAVRSRHPRAAPSDRIATAARDLGMEVASQSEDVALGTRRALDLAGDEDLVLGAGSLSVAAEIIEEIEGIAPELYPELKRAPALPKGTVR